MSLLICFRVHTKRDDFNDSILSVILLVAATLEIKPTKSYYILVPLGHSIVSIRLS